MVCAIHGHEELMLFRLLAIAAFLAAMIQRALAGPPYVTDDPEPTEYLHWEIYVFSGGTQTRDGSAGAGGLDFNYGAGPNLQLSLTLPLGYDSPMGGNHS